MRRLQRSDERGIAMVTAILDSAMGSATWSLLDRNEVYLTADLRTEFYQPTRPGRIRATDRSRRTALRRSPVEAPCTSASPPGSGRPPGTRPAPSRSGPPDRSSSPGRAGSAGSSSSAAGAESRSSTRRRQPRRFALALLTLAAPGCSAESSRLVVFREKLAAPRCSAHRSQQVVFICSALIKVTWHTKPTWPFPSSSVSYRT